jgi:hypothetical protein
MAATSEKYYIKTDSFQTATSLYLDANLTTKASDGFYSLGGIWRQQLNGLLLQVEACVPLNGIEYYVFDLTGVPDQTMVTLYYKDENNQDVFITKEAEEFGGSFYFTAIVNTYEYTEGYVFKRYG